MKWRGCRVQVQQAHLRRSQTHRRTGLVELELEGLAAFATRVMQFFQRGFGSGIQQLGIGRKSHERVGQTQFVFDVQRVRFIQKTVFVEGFLKLFLLQQHARDGAQCMALA